MVWKDDFIDGLKVEVAMLHKVCADHEAEIKRLRAALRDALKLYAKTDDAAPWRINKWSELKEALGEDE
jgi:hypothetical protein